jgi:nitrogen permease regulator 2-like protein
VPQTVPAQDAVPALAPPFPKELLPLLDSEHHTDELCVRFEVGWPKLEQWLVAAGQGNGDGDFGRVIVIYR